MEETVYLDVLIAVNLIINYFLLLMTAHFSKTAVKRWRAAAGALAGALFSSLLLFPEIHIIVLNVLKLGVSSLMTAIAFEKVSKKLFFKQCALLFFSGIVFAGSMFLFYVLFTPASMGFQNGVVYFDISAPLLILLTGAIYAVTRMLVKLFERRADSEQIYKINISFNGNSVVMFGLCDSGNQLRDNITGYPVMICELSKLLPILPQEMSEFFEDFKVADSALVKAGVRIRLIPFGGAGGSGLLPAFRPDYVEFFENKRRRKVKNILVAVTNKLSDNEFDAVLPKDTALLY